MNLFRRRRLRHRKQQKTIHTATGEAAQKIHLILHQPVPRDQIRVVFILVKSLMNSLHDRSGKLALELVERNSDASAPTGLDAFHHCIRLITVFPGNFHDAVNRLFLDSRIPLQRLGNCGFRNPADFPNAF